MELHIVLMNLGVISSTEKVDFLNMSKLEHFGTIY